MEVPQYIPALLMQFYAIWLDSIAFGICIAIPLVKNGCLVVLLFCCFVVLLFCCFVVLLSGRQYLITCSFAFGSVRTCSKGSRITPMRRILSFHGFNFVLLLGIGFTTDCICAFTALDNLQQEIIRERTNPLYPFNPCSFHH